MNMQNGKVISIVCGVRDRLPHLLQTLPTWLACPEVDDVLIVDWSSREPVSPRLKLAGLLDDRRVVIARVEGQEHWCAAKCHNLEVRLAKGEHVLRLDADNLLRADFFQVHQPGDSDFFHADYSRRRNDEDYHLGGVLYARREDILGVGGYNERLLVYAYEDDDLVGRLKSVVTPRPLDFETLTHIPHGDDERLVNAPVERYPELVIKPPDASWMWNRGMAQRALDLNRREAQNHPWTSSDVMLGFYVTLGSEILCHEVGNSSLETELLGNSRGRVISSRTGVSVITGCKDRSIHLVESMDTWLCQFFIDEIIVVDWSSSLDEALEVERIVNQYSDYVARIVLVRVEDEETWQPGPCFNLGLRFATRSHILKLDADVHLKESFDERHRFDVTGRNASRIFYAGDWLRARDENERHLNGVVYARLDDLLTVNGWNERIVTYGYDDNDLYERLEGNGVKRLPLDNASLYHVPHTDVLRLQSQPKRVSSCYMEAEFNRQMSKSTPWRKDDSLIRWHIEQNSKDSTRFVCRRMRLVQGEGT